MKKKKCTPTAFTFGLFRQICNFIPTHLVPHLARKHQSADRSFTAWSHVVSLLYVHFTHALSLNDVCDGLKIFRGPLSAIRGATPPSKNAFSHANRNRNPILMQELFWEVLEHLQTISPEFLGSRRGKRLAYRFKRTVHVLDSTVIKLVMNCFDQAKHRRRTAAAKCHLRLDMQSFLPRFAIIDTGSQHDTSARRNFAPGSKLEKSSFLIVLIWILIATDPLHGEFPKTINNPVKNPRSQSLPGGYLGDMFFC